MLRLRNAIYHQLLLTKAPASARVVMLEWKIVLGKETHLPFTTGIDFSPIPRLFEELGWTGLKRSEKVSWMGYCTYLSAT